MNKIILLLLILCACNRKQKQKQQAWAGYYKDHVAPAALWWNAREGDTVGITIRSWSEEMLHTKGSSQPVVMHTLDKDGNIYAIYTKADSIDYFFASDTLHRKYRIDNPFGKWSTEDACYHKKGALYPSSWGYYFGMKKAYFKSPWVKDVISLDYTDYEGMTINIITTLDSIPFFDKQMGWPQL